jgi:hypothetical protein
MWFWTSRLGFRASLGFLGRLRGLIKSHRYGSFDFGDQPEGSALIILKTATKDGDVTSWRY